VAVVLILGESLLVWTRVLMGKKGAASTEAPYVPTRFALDEG
jgi:hypothetical protein